MNAPTNAADRWHPQLFTIKALVRLVTDVLCDHVGSEHKKCRRDEEVTAAWEALRIAQEKIGQVIDELSDENYRLVEKKPSAA